MCICFSLFLVQKIRQSVRLNNDVTSHTCNSSGNIRVKSTEIEYNYMYTVNVTFKITFKKDVYDVSFSCTVAVAILVEPVQRSIL